jgi:pilus assembly protein CpaF
MEQAVRRSANSEQSWPVVKRLMSFVQQDNELNRLTSRLTLTRDLSVDLAQFTALTELLWAKLNGVPEFAMIPPHVLGLAAELAYDELLGISVFGPFWRDPEVTEILVDAWDRISIERYGRLERTPLRFRDLDHAQETARRLATKVSQRALTQANPLVTAELPGARVTFALGYVVKSGISISIRKFPPLMNMDRLASFGALSPEMRAFLTDAVVARANILVSGGTGTGKTTFVNALSESIPDTERVITIEDAYELGLRNTHWVAMQTKEASSSDDEVRVDLASLLKSTLRMRPDRIIVGEIREAEGASVMLMAANTGHDGTLSTIHAQSADRALNFRLTGLIRQNSQMPAEVAALEVSSAIDIVVQVVRERGVRFVSEITVSDPAMVYGATITPVQIFRGHLPPDAESTPVFEQVGTVPAGSALAAKLSSVSRAAGWVDGVVPTLVTEDLFEPTPDPEELPA